MIAELEERRKQFEAAKSEATQIASGLSDAQFNWRPEPGKWSIAECLDHLYVTGSKLLPGMDAAIQRARERNQHGSGPFEYGWLARWFIRNVSPIPESGKGMKGPKLYAPRPDQPVDRVLPEFLRLQDQLVDRLHAADGLDLGRIKVASPASSLLRLSLGAWFEATAAHQERHLIQARRVREHPRFPPPAGETAGARSAGAR